MPGMHRMPLPRRMHKRPQLEDTGGRAYQEIRSLEAACGAESRKPCEDHEPGRMHAAYQQKHPGRRVVCRCETGQRIQKVHEPRPYQCICGKHTSCNLTQYRKTPQQNTVWNDRAASVLHRGSCLNPHEEASILQGLCLLRPKMHGMHSEMQTYPDEKKSTKKEPRIRG